MSNKENNYGFYNAIQKFILENNEFRKLMNEPICDDDLIEIELQKIMNDPRVVQDEQDTEQDEQDEQDEPEQDDSKLERDTEQDTEQVEQDTERT